MRKALREIGRTIITAALIYLAIQVTTQNSIIEGSSMTPTLNDGERIIVNRFVFTRSKISLMGEEGYLFHGPQRGDIIVFRKPEAERENIVKRVVGIPGDQIDIREHLVWVNGKKQEHVIGKTNPRSYIKYPMILNKDNYFVLGDNRSVSNDSRNWGAVLKTDILGRAWVIYWPLKNISIFG